MRSHRFTRRLALSVGLAAALLALAPAVAGAGSSAPRGWHLVDYHQSACFSSHVTTSWYGIWIRGRWKHAVDVGAEGLPAGASFSTSNAPIPPGSSTGVYSLAYVEVALASGTPLGTYTASLWARSGRTVDTVPITLVVKPRCGY